ncbi:hypothetical protein D3C81_2199640 [compost metagenome]
MEFVFAELVRETATSDLVVFRLVHPACIRVAQESGHERSTLLGNFVDPPCFAFGLK